MTPADNVIFFYITLDPVAREVKGPNGTYHLTPMEVRLLHIFMLNPGRVISRQDLMKHVWDTDWFEDCRTLEVHVCWLRRKLGDKLMQPRYLRTIRGVGYMFGSAERGL